MILTHADMYKVLIYFVYTRQDEIALDIINHSQHFNDFANKVYEIRGMSYSYVTIGNIHNTMAMYGISDTLFLDNKLLKMYKPLLHKKRELSLKGILSK